MKRIALRLTMVASACGGAAIAVVHGTQIMGRLATNHSEPVVSAH